VAAPSPALLFAQARTGITQVAGLWPGNVFDTQVPTTLPKDASGAIRPYVVMFASPGMDLPEERDATGLAGMDVIDFTFQTSCVGPTAAHARDVAHAVRLALTNLPIGAGFVKPDPFGIRVDNPLADNQVVPARFYMPLMWRLTTT
jgi:hypothetical protein